MYGHWYVVANQKNARIFTQVSGRNAMKLVKELENPLGSATRKELIRKEAGVGIRSAGRTSSIRFSKAKRTDPRDDVAVQFAKKIADYLEKAKQKDNYSKLTVVAEPKFLGKIRTAMNTGAKKDVVKWMKKDLQKTPKSQLTKILLPNSKEA